MKIGSILEQLELQEQQFTGEKKKENPLSNNIENKHDSNPIDLGLLSLSSILPSVSRVNPVDEQQTSKPGKKKINIRLMNFLFIFFLKLLLDTFPVVYHS